MSSISFQRMTEQRRLLRELHDGPAQDLWLLAFELPLLSAALPQELAPLQARLQELGRVAAEGHEKVRLLLRSGAAGQGSPLAAARLTALLHVEVASLRARLDPTRLTFTCTPAFADLVVTVEVGKHIAAIMREAAWNARKHGKATRVHAAVTSSRGALVMRVSDNGCGFIPVAARGRGRGLRNMRERARFLGGYLAVRSRPGQGTVVVLRTPLSPLDTARKTPAAPEIPETIDRQGATWRCEL